MFPLVGALEDGLLVTPVMINGRGPYLFALDPDASVSVIDGDVIKGAELMGSKGPQRLDETNIPQTRVYAEVTGLEIGTLIVERLEAIVVRPGTFDATGRRIHGVIGRDVLSDSLVFGFDRDQGLAYLMMPKAFKAPADAVAVPYEVKRNKVPQVAARRTAKAVIGGETFTLHLDLGATASQLRDEYWERAKLVGREVKAGVIDEIGTLRSVSKASEPTSVVLGAAQSDHVAFIPFEDKRWDEGTVDGTLGLGFLGPYNVWVSSDAKTFYLDKRHEVPAATRFGRWDSGPIEKCTTPGCITIRLVDPLNGKPVEEGKTHPGVVLSITREEKAGGMGLEVMLEAEGNAELPRLIVNLPPHIDRLFDQLPVGFLGAKIVVLSAGRVERANDADADVSGAQDPLWGSAQTRRAASMLTTADDLEACARLWRRGELL